MKGFGWKIYLWFSAGYLVVVGVLLLIGHAEAAETMFVGWVIGTTAAWFMLALSYLAKQIFRTKR